MLLLSCNQTASSQINNQTITKIELLIADTSIINFPEKQLANSPLIGDGQSFMDSAGNLICKPSHHIVFNGSDKDTLLNMLNAFSDSLQELTPTTCITLYNHVFLMYNNNQVTEKIFFAFNCPLQFNFLNRGKVIVPRDEQSELLTRFVNQLKSKGAFIPNYGPPPNYR
jgi:hypothetical protein